jgi:hypothetical protein
MQLMYTMRCGLLVASAFCVGASAGYAQELNWAQKMFSELEHDFGVVARGADVRHRILVRNPYKETVTIAKVDTTCGCTAAQPSRTSLKTHETAYIEVVMDTKKFMRQKDSNIDVKLTFDNVHFKDVRIPIHAYIRSDVVMQPGAAEFGAVDLGAGAKRTIKLEYAGRDNWQIREVRSNKDYLSASVQETQRGGGRVGYNVIVTLDPSAPQGAIREELTLITDDASNPYVPLAVSAVVEPDIVVATPEVALGPLSPGVEKTVRVVVRGRKPFSIETIECESDLECFKVKLSQDPKTVHVLPITVTPPDLKGDFKEHFTVRISGREQPVTFEASGRIE